MVKVYISAALVQYTLKGNIHDDTSALEYLQSLDEEFAASLETDVFLRRIFIKYLKRESLDELMSNLVTKSTLITIVRAAKLRSCLCILQQERMRKNLDWIKEEERKKVIRDIHLETCQTLNMIKDFQRDFPDVNEHVEKLEWFTKHRVDHTSRRSAFIED